MNADIRSTASRPLRSPPRLYITALACLCTCSSVAEAPAAAAFAGPPIDAHLQELLRLHSPDLLLVSNPGRVGMAVGSQTTDIQMKGIHR